jgi:hypothetical protein
MHQQQQQASAGISKHQQASAGISRHQQASVGISRHQQHQQASATAAAPSISGFNSLQNLCRQPLELLIKWFNVRMVNYRI